jgi:hypothetical protein
MKYTNRPNGLKFMNLKISVELPFELNSQVYKLYNFALI